MWGIMLGRLSHERKCELFHTQNSSKPVVEPPLRDPNKEDAEFIVKRHRADDGMPATKFAHADPNTVMLTTRNISENLRQS